jgi:hypothetical protein
MTQTTLEYVLGSMYIALMSAGFDAPQRVLANDTMMRCADLTCAPVCVPEILRRIARNAVNHEPAAAHPRQRVISGDAA